MSRVGIGLESPHQETQKVVTLSFPVTLSHCHCAWGAAQPDCSGV